MNADEFIRIYTGKFIDVDGFPADNRFQCWDVWSRYAQVCCGLSLSETITPTGYASGLWTHNVGLRVFDRVSSSAKAHKGDVAIWTRNHIYTGSHVAIVVEDRGSTLYCLSQNPGPARLVNLPKIGLLGYLRPKDKNITKDEGEEDMPVKTDTINLPNGGSTVTVEYFLQALWNDMSARVERVEKTLSNLGLSGNKALSDAQVTQLARQLEKTLGKEVVKTLAEKLGA